jgi:KTSC domain
MTAWDRVILESASLAAAIYDVRRGTLQLDFRDGTRYVYSKVAPGLYRDLLCATSQGYFFNRQIRGHFPYAKLAPEN